MAFQEHCVASPSSSDCEKHFSFRKMQALTHCKVSDMNAEPPTSAQGADVMLPLDLAGTESRTFIRGKETGRTGRCFPLPREQQVFQRLEGMMRPCRLENGVRDDVCHLRWVATAFS